MYIYTQVQDLTMDMAENNNFKGLQPLSARHLHLIKWIPNGETTVKKLKISEAISSIWRGKIAVLLGLSHSQIVSIENPGSGNTPQRCIDEVLEKWRETRGQESYPYTWTGLLELLDDAEVKVLAIDLKKALSSEFSTAKGNLGQVVSKGVAQKEDDLYPHYPHIYALLDIDKLYPHLCREGLLNATEQNKLTKHERTREQKISKLLKMVSRKGSDAQRQFVDCVGQISGDDATQNKLYKILLNRDISKKEKHSNFSTIITLATVSLVLLTLIFFVKYPGAFNFFDRYQSKSLIHLSKIFVGREQEMSQLMDLLDFSSDADVRIVNIVGSPGFGKSTLAVHVGDQMVRQGVEVHYVNMDEYQGKDINIQIELAEKILRAADYSSDRYTFEDLIKWLRKLFWNSLIIIDDCDNLVHNNRTHFFHALKKIVEQTPRIKVLITSREVTIHLEYVRRYRIYELSKRASCELFEQILPVGTNLTTAEIEEIAKLTGNAPLALQIVGALLSSPNPPSPSYIIGELNSRPITLLSHEDLQHEHKLNVSISLSYRYLSPEMQMISQYLAKFPGSFNLEAANTIVICGQVCSKNISQNESPVTKTLRSLTSRSLIEFNLIKKQRYTFHRLIKEFLREEQVSDSNKTEFNSNFQNYYSSLLTQTIDIFEADYKLALHNLGIERHNYQKILDDLKTNNHDLLSFLHMITSIARALWSTIRILSFSFSDEEIMNTMLSALEYIEENQLLGIRQEINILYLTLVNEVIRIKKHMFGIEDALKTYTERKNIVNAITVNMSNSNNFTGFIVYKQLTILHEELGNYEKAKECHTKVGFTDLGSKCIGIDSQCSFQEIGQLYYFMGCYEQSAPYLELASQNNSLTTIQQFCLLVDLAIVNTYLKRIPEVERYSQELHSILQDDLLAALDIYKHRSKLTQIIRHLQIVNLQDIGNDLEEKLIEVVLDIESHANSTICSQQNDNETLKVLEHYYDQRKYKKTIQLGEIVLKKLQTCSK